MHIIIPYVVGRTQIIQGIFIISFIGVAFIVIDEQHVETGCRCATKESQIFGHQVIFGIRGSASIIQSAKHKGIPDGFVAGIRCIGNTAAISRIIVGMDEHTRIGSFDPIHPGIDTRIGVIIAIDEIMAENGVEVASAIIKRINSKQRAKVVPADKRIKIPEITAFDIEMATIIQIVHQCIGFITAVHYPVIIGKHAQYAKDVLEIVQIEGGDVTHNHR